MFANNSPLQSPSSMYSHAPTIVHHGPHRSALARRAMNLSTWGESPSTPQSRSAAPRASEPTSYNQTANDKGSRSYTPTMQDPIAEYEREAEYDRESDIDPGDRLMEDDSCSVSEYSPPSLPPVSGITLRKYAELRFNEDDHGEAQLMPAPGFEKSEKRVEGWVSPESTLAGLGRQATRMMKAATGSSQSFSSYAGSSGRSSGPKSRYEDSKALRDKSRDHPVNIRRLGETIEQPVGLGLSLDLNSIAASGRNGRDFLASSSAVSISSSRSRGTDASDRMSSSDSSSINDAVITPNLSSAFTPYTTDASTKILPSRKIGEESSNSHTLQLQYGSSYANPGSNYTGLAYPSRQSSTRSTRSRDQNPSVTPILAASSLIGEKDTHTANFSPSPALFNLTPTPASFAATDRPLLSSGSPGFGLISLEAAQERERERITGIKIRTPLHAQEEGRKGRVYTTPRLPTAPSPPRTCVRASTEAPAPAVAPVPIPTPGSATKSKKIRNKKSLISLFRSATSYATSATPPLPSLGLGGRKIQIGDPLPLVRNDPSPRPSVEHDMNSQHEGSTIRSGLVSVDPDRSPYSQYHPGTTAFDPVETQDHDWERLPVPKPQLELRPVSMTFTNGLPSDYLATQAIDFSEVPDSGVPVGSKMQEGVSHEAQIQSESISSSLFSKAEDAPEIIQLKRELANLKRAHHTQLSELSSQVRELRDNLAKSQQEVRELRDNLAKSQQDLVESETAREQVSEWMPREDGCTACGCTCGMGISERLMGGPSSPGPIIFSPSVKYIHGRARSGTTRSTKSTRSIRSQDTGTAVGSGMIMGSGEKMPVIPKGGVMDRARVKTKGARGVFGTGNLYQWE